MGEMSLDKAGNSCFKMPSREELISSIVGCLGAPAANIVGVIGAPASSIAGIVVEERANAVIGNWKNCV